MKDHMYRILTRNDQDSEYTAILKTVGEGETFGPTTW